MDNLTLKEELQVMKAASLADRTAPEDINTERSRAFVHDHMATSQSGRRRFTFMPAVRYIAIAAAACIAIALIAFTPRSNAPLIPTQQNSIHAAADSLREESDSLKIESAEQHELTVIDE